MTDASGATEAGGPRAALDPDARAEDAALARFLTRRRDAIRTPEPRDVVLHPEPVAAGLGWQTARAEWWGPSACRPGAERTAFMDAVLRETRCTAKPAGLGGWKPARRAIAELPQRARALSALDFETMCRIREWPLIEVQLLSSTVAIQAGWVGEWVSGRG